MFLSIDGQDTEIDLVMLLAFEVKTTDCKSKLQQKFVRIHGKTAHRFISVYIVKTKNHYEYNTSEKICPFLLQEMRRTEDNETEAGEAPGERLWKRLAHGDLLFIL